MIDFALKYLLTCCRLWQLRKFITKVYKYKTPHGIFGENSEHKPSLAIATNGCYKLFLFFG